MPRQSRGPAPASRRPTAPAPARPAAPAQTRPASTAAYPPQQRPGAAAQPPQQAAAPQSSGGSGLFGQMASTAAGVAVGSSIGHAIGGFFGGGSSAAPPAPPVEAGMTPAQDGSYYAQSANSNTNSGSRVCEVDVNNFQRCMNENQGNLTVCSWYLDQLKACQQAASQY